jgi:flagellar biosynthetic protein FliR
MPVIQLLQSHLPVFLLIFLRLSALFLIIPIFGYTTIYPRLRVLFAFIFSLILLPILKGAAIPALNLGLLVVLCLREVGLGLVIGYGARLIFEAFNYSGTLIAQQTGFAMATVFDPTSEQQATVISQFWFLLMMVYLFSSDAHFYLLEVIVRNFQILPLGTTTLQPSAVEQLGQGTSLFFEISFKIAAPIVMLMLTLEAALALLARVMPQMNVFFVTLPLKLAVGIIAIISSLTIFQTLFAYFIDDLLRFMERILAALR